MIIFNRHDIWDVWIERLPLRIGNFWVRLKLKKIKFWGGGSKKKSNKSDQELKNGT